MRLGQLRWPKGAALAHHDGRVVRWVRALGRHQPAVYRSILVIDVEKFGDPARTNADQVAVRDGVYQALAGALASSGISRSSCRIEDRGDGALVLIAPEVPKSWLVTRLPIELAAALGDHNVTCAANARIRLRMALHAGEIHPDAHGVTGSAVTRAFRLIEAPALKSALDDSAGVLALIVSDWFYDEVVRHEPAAEPGCYRQVHAVVKETRAAAWIHILEVPAGKAVYQAESVTGEHPRRRARGGGGVARRKTGASLGGRSQLAPPRQLPASPPGFVGRDGELAQLHSLLPPPGRRRSGSVVIAAIHGCMAVVTSRCRLSGLAVRDGAQRINLDALPAAQAVAGWRRPPELPVSMLSPPPRRSWPACAGGYRSRCGSPPNGLPAAPVLPWPTWPVSWQARATGWICCVPVMMMPPLSGRCFPGRTTPLSPAAAGVFRSLGLLAGPDVCAPAVAALIAADTATARQLLELLAREYLVEQSGQDRYRLHDLLRLYAAERGLAEDTDEDRSAARRRVLDWYLHTAYAANGAITRVPRHFAPDAAAEGCVRLTFATARQALDWYGSEHANLMASIGMAAETGHHVVAWQIPAALWSYFVIRKPWHDVITSHQLGLAAAREIGDRSGEAWMLLFLGYAYRVRCPEEAIGYCHQALAIFRELGARLGQAHALYVLGLAYHELRRSEEALGYCQQALAIGRELGDRPSQARALTSMSAILRGVGRSGEAIGYCDQALAIFRELGDRWGQGLALTTSARTNMDLRRFEEAVTMCRQALSVHREIGDRNGEADALNTLSAAYRDMGRYREAVGYSRQALSIVREIGDRHGEGITLTKLGTALCADGQTGTARRCWRDALAILDGLASPKAGEARMLLEKLDPGEADQHVAETPGRSHAEHH